MIKKRGQIDNEEYPSFSIRFFNSSFFPLLFSSIPCFSYTTRNFVLNTNNQNDVDTGLLEIAFLIIVIEIT